MASVNERVETRTRRDFIRWTGLASGILVGLPLLSACQQAAPAPAPTAAPTAAPKPATAPVAPTAPPAAAKPTTAPTVAPTLPVVRTQGLSEGMNSVLVKTMQLSGIAEKNGFRVEPITTTEEAAVQQFLQRNSDVSTDAELLGVATWRNEGRKIVAFTPSLNNFMVILAKKDSPYNSVTDLKGKRLGQIGLNSGMTTTFAVLMRRIYNLDYQKDFQLVQASAAALIPLLDRGDIDATMLFDPFVTRALIDGQVKVIYGPYSEEWRKATGAPISLTVTAAYEDWIMANKATARNVARAVQETAAWIPKNLNIFDQPEIQKITEVSDPNTLALLKQRVTELGIFNVSWDAAAQKAHQEFIQIAAQSKVVIDKDPGGTVVDLATFAA